MKRFILTMRCTDDTTFEDLLYCLGTWFDTPVEDRHGNRLVGGDFFFEYKLEEVKE